MFVNSFFNIFLSKSYVSDHSVVMIFEVILQDKVSVDNQHVKKNSLCWLLTVSS